MYVQILFLLIASLFIVGTENIFCIRTKAVYWFSIYIEYLYFTFDPINVLNVSVSVKISIIIMSRKFNARTVIYL